MRQRTLIHVVFIDITMIMYTHRYFDDKLFLIPS